MQMWHRNSRSFVSCVDAWVIRLSSPVLLYSKSTRVGSSVVGIETGVMLARELIEMIWVVVVWVVASCSCTYYTTIPMQLHLFPFRRGSWLLWRHEIRPDKGYHCHCCRRISAINSVLNGTSPYSLVLGAISVQSRTQSPSIPWHTIELANWLAS